jgi:hypothetical protein
VLAAIPVVELAALAEVQHNAGRSSTQLIREIAIGPRELWNKGDAAR